MEDAFPGKEQDTARTVMIRVMKAVAGHLQAFCSEIHEVNLHTDLVPVFDLRAPGLSFPDILFHHFCFQQLTCIHEAGKNDILICRDITAFAALAVPKKNGMFVPGIVFPFHDQPVSGFQFFQTGLVWQMRGSGDAPVIQQDFLLQRFEQIKERGIFDKLKGPGVNGYKGVFQFMGHAEPFHSRSRVSSFAASLVRASFQVCMLS